MHLFIYSQLTDAHAIAVKAALESIGVKVTRFVSDQFPANAEISTLLSPELGKTDFYLPINNSILQPNQSIDVVWNRRPALPKTSNLDIHKDDISVVERECKEFWNSFVVSSFPNASWINTWESSKKARSKLLQLATAKECGFKIPKTLFSNNPEDIKRFLTLNSESTKTIVKSFLPVNWTEGLNVKTLYATEVDAAKLPSDYLLRVAPAIYQEKIPKAYEIRSTFFGPTGLHAKIDAEKNGAPLQDWRQGYYFDLKTEPHLLPLDIETKCLAFMKKLNLKFGCFDFIVTPDGEYIFLEVNEAGQFLWVERYCPEIKMMNAFCKFVLDEGNVSNGLQDSFDFSAIDIGDWPEVRSALAEEEKL